MRATLRDARANGHEEGIRRVFHRRLDAVIGHYDQHVIRIEGRPELGETRVDVTVDIQQHALAVVLALSRELAVEGVRQDVERLEPDQQQIDLPGARQIDGRVQLRGDALHATPNPRVFHQGWKASAFRFVE